MGGSAARWWGAVRPCSCCTEARASNGRTFSRSSSSLPPATAWRSTSSAAFRPRRPRAPYDVATQVADVVAVLDGLGWQKAVVAGHSWGGHLLLHLLASHPERIAAALAIDTLGGVGDGGEAEFDVELYRRTPPRDLERVAASRASGDGRPCQRGRARRVVPAALAGVLRRPGRGAAVPAPPELGRGVRGDVRIAARRAAAAGRSACRRDGADRPRARSRESDAGHGVDRHGRGDRLRSGDPGARRRRALSMGRAAGRAAGRAGSAHATGRAGPL